MNATSLLHSTRSLIPIPRRRQSLLSLKAWLPRGYGGGNVAAVGAATGVALLGLGVAGFLAARARR